MSLTAVKDELREFAHKREREQFHSPLLGSPFTPGQALLTTLWELVVTNAGSVTETVLTYFASLQDQTVTQLSLQGAPGESPESISKCSTP